MNASRWPIRRVLVVGPSMVPSLRHRDQVLVVRMPVRAGDIVMGEFAARPGLLVVKRALRPTGDGMWWIQGDNAAVADDSRRYGPARLHGRVLWRYWPPVRRR